MSGSDEPPGERLDRSLVRLRSTFLALGARSRASGERPAVVSRDGGPATATVAYVNAVAIDPVRPSDWVATATVGQFDRGAAEPPHHPGLLRQVFAKFFGRWLPWRR